MGTSKEVADKVIKLDGESNLYELLRTKIKYFSDGVVIGSPSFIERQRRRLLEKKGASAKEVEEMVKRGRRKDELSEDSLVTWRW